MKFLIASDIHGSLVYTRALLDRFEKEGADRLVLLGDILYHGPRNDIPEGYDTKGVAAALNEYAERVICVRGNCDAAVDQLMLSFPVLGSFGVIADGERLLYLTHGDEYGVDNPPPVLAGDAVLSGHTHVPVFIEKNGVLFVNPGSTSIPKGGSTRGYILYENGRFLRKSLSGELENEYVFKGRK